MKPETDKLVALIKHAVQKDVFIPVTGKEFLSILKSLEAALKILPVTTHDPLVIKNDLKQAYDVLSGLLYCLSKKPLIVHLDNRRCIAACTGSLLKKITDDLKWYCSKPLYHNPVIPVRDLHKTLVRIQIHLSKNAELGQLNSLVFPHFPCFKQIKTLPYHHWQWWSQFAGYMLDNPITGLQSLEDALVLVDFNTAGFIDWLSAGIAQQIDSKESVLEKLNFISNAIVKFNLINIAAYSYIPAKRSVKGTLLSVLQTRLRCLRNVTGEIGQLHRLRSLKLNTMLSVPQLALFIRLMIDTKIINETNCAGLMKNVVSVISTSKVSLVSSESLRINYYTPGNAAKNIMKDYLINMINLLRTY